MSGRLPVQLFRISRRQKLLPGNYATPGGPQISAGREGSTRASSSDTPIQLPGGIEEMALYSNARWESADARTGVIFAGCG